MKISGIVCEYNPFHNGHAYHIRQTRRNGASHIVCVMSGNFVQRGDVAVLDKFTRAELAVECGADLVIELPVAYCLAPAEIFARGAVYLLDGLGCVDEISFGSECGDVAVLENAMNIADDISHTDSVAELIRSGYTCPRAVSEILRQTDSASAEIIAEPNNILAVEYLRALNYLKSAIKPFTVKRSGAGHDSTEISRGFASASYIRAHIESAGKFVPEIWAEALHGDTALLSRLERIILYKIRTATEEEICDIPDSSALIGRIYGNNAQSLDGLFESIKSKNCTMAKVKRVILSLLIGITETHIQCLPPYARVLAFNENGREVLALAKKTKKIPVGTSLAKLGRLDLDAHCFAELEARATDIYNLARNSIYTAGQDYRAKIKKSGVKL
ncbi:MAG: nucleotidyltransferase family protein [Ruminococcus flavefaciens]|nr:nucleotidyltransferase family protein [Ruminococcus flavefaciens]MCM1229745.1 nucleotidyltransferase family protein [Ruminococcus flavefaciens]